MRTGEPGKILPKEILRQLLIFFMAIVVSVVLFMMIAVYMNQADGAMAPQWAGHYKIASWLVAAVSLLCFGIARQQFKKRSAAAKNSLNDLHDKLMKYRTALILYLAICEAPAILSIVLFLLSGDFVFLALAAIMLGFMLSAAPVRRTVVAALDLDGEQQKELD
jgi:hypothetical protein